MKSPRISDDVQSVHLYKHRPVVFHLYALPFAIIYLLWGYVYFWAKPQALETLLQTNESWADVDSNPSTGSENHITSNISDTATEVPANETVNLADDLPDISNLTVDELWLIGAALLGILHLLLCLSCVWSVHIRCLVTCKKVKRLRQAQCVKVVPTPNNGHTELVDLQRRKVSDPDDAESSKSPEISYWIEFQKTVLVCDDESKGEFQPVMFPTSWNFRSYANWRGYESADKLTDARIKYGRNDMEMVLPKFKTLMAERATAPFFVFQVFCVGLWCLDEAVYYSLFTLFMLVVFEATLVQQQMRNMSTIRDMGNKPTQVYVYRSKKWEIAMSNELVAGDVISVSTSAPPSSASSSGGVAGGSGRNKQSTAASSSSSIGSVTCDLLLLRGQCIVDEAMLTGESVPQMKEPISEQLQVSKQNNGNDSNKISSDESCFNFASHGKLHVIYGGTKVLQTSWRNSSAGVSDSGSAHTGNNTLLSGIKSPPDHGCICFVLRTGFNTSQGKLLRTILFGVKRVTANNLETFFFILFLLIFAVSAASYVWIEGCKNPARNRYKLLLECTLIITSVVPPELPIELSLAVNSSMIALAKLAIFCTEPFRIPFAGKIDFCCFDKTGTLTSDTFVVEGVAGLPPVRNGKIDHAGDKSSSRVGDSSTSSEGVTLVSNLPKETLESLATCHSLGHMSAPTSNSSSESAGSVARSANQSKDTTASLIGDPLEKATFTAIQYTLSKNDVVSPPSGSPKDLKPWQIVSRFHFTSKLKRMTTLSVQTSSFTGETTVLAAVKGAPETLKPMFEQPPLHYDETFRKMTLSGARVLAVGYRYMHGMSISSAKQLTRSNLECNLKFGGFLIVSCPLKPDSKSVMADILKSSHHVAMITGDNALTACHVARELEIIKKDRSNNEIMILEPSDSNKDDVMNGSAGSTTESMTSSKAKMLEDEWVWKSIDGWKEFPLFCDEKSMSKSVGGAQKWWKNYSFCLTGPGLQYLQDLKSGADVLKRWVPRVCVFARVSPQQKEDVVTILKQLRFHTLMCGDGTNDVGALKHAHCGVALLSQPQKPAKKSSSNSSSSSQHSNSSAAAVGKNRGQGAMSHSKQNPFANISSNPRVQARADELMKKSALAQKLAKDLEEAEGPTVVKLGDASIASPFTSKASSIESVCHIMKQGRCTLVTTLQMFKILALNALIFAYGQSVLYLDGVKFSDTQATLQGLLLAGCFLFVSRSQPLKVLSKERPLPNIFNIYTILTVCAQFTIHFSSLIFVVRQAKQNIPPKPEGEFVDLEKDFEPNILNSVVYLIDMGMQVSTFAVNYRGEPFMQSLWSHKPLRNCLLITFIVVLTLTAHLMPELNEWFQLVPFPEDLQRNLVLVIIADALGCWLVDRVLCFIFGTGSLKNVK